MIEMVKSKQTISQVRNVKQWKAIRNQSQIQEIYYEIPATALRPRLHHREGFPLNPQRELQEVYTRPEYRTPTNPTSTQEGSQHKEL